jgi:NADH-quinone oxidoreductase subunit L
MPLLPAWLFYVPIIIAYITPFYMMRCWWLTFCGKPRDHHVHEHAHESWKMYMPLVVLAVGTIFSSYYLFRPLIHDAASVAADSSLVVALDGEAKTAAEAGGGVMLTLTHEAGRNPHHALVAIVGFAWLIGMGVAALLYREGLGIADRLRRLPLVKQAHRALEQKLYFDHVYDNVLVGGTIVLGYVMMLFDKIVIDGLVNLSAFVTRIFGVLVGRQFDMSVEQGDIGLVDAIANGIARTALDAGSAVRRPQTGRIRTYVLVAAGSVAVVLCAVLIVGRL